MMYYGNGDWGGMLLAMAFNAVVWIALIGLLIWAVSRLFADRSSRRQSDRGPSAMEILQQRYARSEVDTATFDEMRSRLETTATPAGSSD
jgi:putative membrane protein